MTLCPGLADAQDEPASPPHECAAEIRAVATLAGADWNNTTIWRCDLAEEVAKLKQARAATLSSMAAAALVHALTDHDLVDEFRLDDLPDRARQRQKTVCHGTRIGLCAREARCWLGHRAVRYARWRAGS